LHVSTYKYIKMKKAFRKIFTVPLFSLLVFAANSCAQPKSSVTGNDVKKETGAAFAVSKSVEEWRSSLTPEQFEVLINKGTERPYTGKLLHNDKTGDYVCAACNNVLFKSDAKFDSHCGWPSFDKAIEGGKVITKTDNSHGMERTEVLCARCGGHLGHLFDDGPTKTGFRYCINSASLGFKESQKSTASDLPSSDTVVLAGGCFWSMQAIYQKLKGVTNVAVGYSGGTKANPSYEDVSTGNTGYAESVQVVYNPNEIKLVDILKVFFSIHNPTTMNKQGADEGTQYRSAIFFNTNEQKNVAAEVIGSLQKNRVFDNAIVTAVQPLTKFYKAEDYHQDYYNNNKGQGYCQVVVAPKIEKFEKAFKDLLKQ
jgi:peptide methionine sulfoxide reductase msrA/msrB